MATPSPARTTEQVNAAAPGLSATLLSTSAQANEEAPSSAGPICASRLPACGVEDFVTMGVRCGERPQANAEARAARLFPARDLPTWISARRGNALAWPAERSRSRLCRRPCRGMDLAGKIH